MKSVCSKLAGFVIAAIITASCSMVASADDAKGKIAVLDVQRAVMTTTQAREQIKALQSDKEYSETRKKAEALQKDMQKKADDAKKNGSTWTADQQAGYQKDWEFMQKDLQLNAQKLEAAEQGLLRQVMKDMQPKLKKVVDEVVTSEKITLLLRADAAIFAVPEVDITDKVVEKLNSLK